MSDRHVILLGASTRAAAGSARRAGLTPWCADLFADADLQRMATVRKVPIEAYPQGLLDALAEAPRAPVIYTGALENRPDLIARIDRPLWGNSPEVLRAVRSPMRWTQCLQACGLPCPAISEEPTATGRWLLKPRKSAGGLGIRCYDGQRFNPRTYFLQQWIDGPPCSGIFLGNYDEAMLLGVTTQLVGIPWLHATGFLYAGNIGPLPLEPAQQSCWSALGNQLAKTFHLRGLFGVDAIRRDGVPWPIEINPRYTASVEVLERSYGKALLPLHRDAFSPLPLREGPGVTPNPSPGRRGEKEIHGKALLYARQTFAFPAKGPWLAALEAGVHLDAADYADIPHAGEIIEQGRPVLTLFASGATAAACLGILQENAKALDRCLWG
jgi:predicted ATP-grasp superfamily ATP-dependent carboligase